MSHSVMSRSVMSRSGGLPIDRLDAPYDPLPRLSSATRLAIEQEALRLNDRYLLEIIEHYAFCPFSKEGRAAGATQRIVYLADTASTDPLLTLMEETVASGLVVTQIILPLVEIGHAEFTRFCHDLTAAGHARMGAGPVLAVAPLHPDLPFGDTPQAMVPLFRRAPDPTIQWVRLDGLEGIYAGRSADDRYVSPSDVPAYLEENPRGTPSLYDRIAQTNASMARRLGIPQVVELLASISNEGRERYARILLSEPA